MDKGTRDYIANAIVSKVNGNIDAKLSDIYERINPIAEDVASIKAEMKYKVNIDQASNIAEEKVNRCRESRDANNIRVENVRNAISKKDWVKIIILIVAAIAGYFGIDLSFQ